MLFYQLFNQSISFDIIHYIQTEFHKSWDTVQIVNKNRMQ